MTTLFLNVETVPFDAFEGQALPPAWAYDATVQPPPERKAVPKNLVDPLKIAARREAIEQEYQECLAEMSSTWAERAAKLWEKSSLDPLRARIVVGCVAVDHSPPYVLPGEDILDWLQDIINDDVVLSAYNCGFDRQMIFGRALATGHDLVARDVRHHRWVDPGEVWRSLGSRWFAPQHTTLNDLCAAFKIPHNPAFTGADVLKAYIRGDHDAIAAHCLDRVTALRELYWKVCP